MRIIYFFWASDALIYMLLIYAKGRQEDLSAKEKKTLRALVNELTEL